ncbi:Transposase family tnp2 [Rhizoctonia solani]|uniref:Transposase family tnp2 n=1 Tax=Rhizoctonia solani TaxID=456999 RepID=A0A8H7H030_9AGAM|nr:Transposase family tnp2 [Rhizoctonia solani]
MQAHLSHHSSEVPKAIQEEPAIGSTPDPPAIEIERIIEEEEIELDEEEIPDTESDIWEEVFRHHQHYNQGGSELSRQPSSSGASRTQTAPDNPSELDNISLISLEDRYANIDPTMYGLSEETVLEADELVEQAVNAPIEHTLLEPDNIQDLSLFDFFVKHRPTKAMWEALMERYQPIGSNEDARIPSIKRLRSVARLWSGYVPLQFDCCINSCVLFTGYLDKAETCPVCHADWFTWSGVGVNTFTYLPLIPQLRACFLCPELAKKMRHRHNYSNPENTISDIFDGSHYKKLWRTKVVIEGKEQPYCFFEEEHEIALGLAANGMCPFKRRKNSCWPLLLINYNLPPDERTHIDNLICIGVVPGPKCPADLNSFLQPLIKELLELAHGVAAVDITTRKLFALRAHLIAVFGDIPAITKILEFIGHNGCFPCQFCYMPTVSGPTSGGGFHRYCPLHQPDGVQTDPLNLPMRTHKETIRLGLEVLRAPNENARSACATETGIKGVTLLARLPSISIPGSFPVDFMHMVWQNLLPQLIDLWTGNFNNLDSGLEDYMLKPTVLSALNAALKPSRKTMPTQFGCGVPELSKRSEFIAETWDVFTTQLSPSLLRRAFNNPRYYEHFVRLAKLLRTLISFDLPRDELPSLRRGIAEWVQEYEQIYYQFDEERLQACPVNLHYLLHLVDSIEFLGPIGGYWAYPMERFCSYIGNSVKSRRYPYANIDQRVLNRARLHIIIRKYQLSEKAPFAPKKRGKTEVPTRIGSKRYKNILLLTPNSKMLKVSNLLRLHITRYLTTSFDVNSHDIEDLIPAELEQWGRFQIDHGGDEFQARGYHKLRPDGRDASFVRYELMVDQEAHRPAADERYERESQFGQLEFVFALRIGPENPPINPSKSKTRTLLLAHILEAPVRMDDSHDYTVLWYEGKLGSGEVVDVRTIQCVVGRIQEDRRWWIVDRAAENRFTYPEFV